MKLLRAAWLLSVSALTAAAEPAGWAPSLTATAAWNSNASNADRASDVVSAVVFRADLEAFSSRISLGRDDALIVEVDAGAESWPRFAQLNRAMLGPRLAWQHKFGLGALAPVLRFELAADRVTAQDNGRSGTTRSLRVAWRQRVDENTQLAFSYEQSRHDAREAVYSRSGGEAVAEVTRELDERWRVALAARWRDGDVLSYATPPRNDLVALARERTDVDTFHRPQFAYSISARTLGGSLALTRALDGQSSCTLNYEGLSTTRGSLRYVNHLVSAAFTRQF